MLPMRLIQNKRVMFAFHLYSRPHKALIASATQSVANPVWGHFRQFVASHKLSFSSRQIYIHPARPRVVFHWLSIADNHLRAEPRYLLAGRHDTCLQMRAFLFNHNRCFCTFTDKPWVICSKLRLVQTFGTRSSSSSAPGALCSTSSSYESQSWIWQPKWEPPTGNFPTPTKGGGGDNYCFYRGKTNHHHHQ